MMFLGNGWQWFNNSHKNKNSNNNNNNRFPIVSHEELCPRVTRGKGIIRGSIELRLGCQEDLAGPLLSGSRLKTVLPFGKALSKLLGSNQPELPNGFTALVQLDPTILALSIGLPREWERVCHPTLHMCRRRDSRFQGCKGGSMVTCMASDSSVRFSSTRLVNTDKAKMMWTRWKFDFEFIHSQWHPYNSICRINLIAFHFSRQVHSHGSSCPQHRVHRTGVNSAMELQTRCNQSISLWSIKLPWY